MADIRPFQALRPSPQAAAQVASVPYDVVNRDEAAALAQGNPLSFLHVSRPEIDLPASTDAYDPAVYAQARRALDQLRGARTLVPEAKPSLYVYRLTMNGRAQTGVAATFSVDEYERGDIRRHELTRKDKEDDRTRHLMALGAQTGPVFLAHRDLPAIDQLVAAITGASAPTVSFIAADGVQHELWVAPDPAALVTAFAAVPRLYIADGHHRAASAARARAELRKSGKAKPGDSADYFLAVAFPASQLHVYPYHRVMHEMGAHSGEDLLQRVHQRFTLREGVDPRPKRGEFAMYVEVGGKARWYGLKPLAAVASPKNSGDPIARLDVSRLQDEILKPIFGIADPRTDKRIDFVGGIRGTAELERLVQSGRAKVAFALHPTTLEDLFEVSDLGGIMPPKSTWFEPKLRDGLLSHEIA